MQKVQFCFALSGNRFTFTIYFCYGLTSVTIPNSVTSIGNYAFQYCSGLTSVTIGNSVTSIGDNAFERCSGLTSVTIPNSVTSIGDEAFSGCSALTSVTIGNSVTSIGSYAFSGCSGLTSVHISDIATWCKIDFEHSDLDHSYSSNPLNYAHHLYLNGEEVKDLVIPNSVTSIGSSAFSGCSGLTSVTIGSGVESIGNYAFANCPELLDVYCYAEKVPSTESDAFNGSYPEYITLHVPAASIDSYKATAPWSSIVRIVGLSGEEPEQPEEVEIDGIKYDLNAEAKQATVIAKSSGKYSGEIVIPESVEFNGISHSVTSIGDYAFFECSGLTSITITNSVTSIGEGAFYGCDGLTSVTIGNSVTSIGHGAFIFCSRLTSVHISDIAAWCNIDFDVFDGSYSNPLSYAHHLYLNGEEVKDLVIPNSVTSIGKGAFFGSSGLTSVTIPNSVTSIGSGAFAYCSGLTSVTIPNSVTSIGEQAFYYCKGLTSIVVEDGNPVYDSRNNCNAIIETATNTLHSGCKTTIIPNSVTSIGDFAFDSCSALTSVTIPNSVTSIGRYAFSGCSGLTSVTIPNSVTSIGEQAFSACSGLTSVTIPNSVTSIGEWAFSGCSELLDVYCYAEKVPSTESNVFNGSYPENANLHVPAASIDSYKATAPWSSFGKIVGLSEIESGVISVPAAPVLVQGNGGVLSVSGVAKGTDVVVYTISGTEVARSTATNGTATISTGLQSGTIVVVKFGNKSVKVRI